MPGHQYIVPPGRRYLERPLDVLVALDLAEVAGKDRKEGLRTRCCTRRRDRDHTRQVADQSRERGHRDDFRVRHECGLSCILDRDEHPGKALLPRQRGHRQHPRTWRTDPSSESSPSDSVRSSHSGGIWPEAASVPSAIGRSYAGPSFEDAIHNT